MVRSVLGVKTAAASGLDVTHTRAGTKLSGVELQARLRQQRSASYIEAMSKLDAGEHTHDAKAVNALVDAIRQEMPDVEVESMPVGIVSRCHLGPPYEVHTLDCTGQIVRHFKHQEGLPAMLERARSLALHHSYAFIEVYPARLIAVSHTGKTSVIEL